MKENMKNEKEKTILKELKKTKKEAVNSSGEKYYNITVKQIKETAGKFQTTSREVEILALQNNIIPKRYQRNLGVISPSEQVKLLQSKVAIIGAGGLGGTILELLARMGIGKLIIADKDIMGDSNLNRQILSIDSNNVKKIIEGVGVVVDALDNLPVRFIIQQACRELNIPMVHGAIAGFNGQLTTIFPEDKGLELIYGLNKDLPEHGSETELGSPTVTPALIASLEAQEVVKILLKRGKLFRNRLLYLDIEEGTMEILKLVVSE